MLRPGPQFVLARRALTGAAEASEKALVEARTTRKLLKRGMWEEQGKGGQGEQHFNVAENLPSITTLGG